VSRFARSYAEAFLGAAPAGYDPEPFLEGGAALWRAISAEARLRAFLGSPAIPLEAKQRLLEELGGKAGLDDFGRRLLGLVLSRGRILHLSDILSAIREAHDRRRGVVEARVKVAAPIGEAERGRIEEALVRQLGRTVRMQVEVVPGLLGGFVARVGSEVFDASVAHAIERFREEAKTGA
jgi:F-type H+-transporting ATPase subunit delta